MARFSRIFKIEQGAARRLAWGDVVILTVIAVFLYSGILLAKHASGIGAEAPPISLSPVELPVYAYLSIRRMALAYLLSLLFTLVYGYQAARSRRAERILIPILDILQSVPILSFLPVVLLGLSAILPQGLATELASILLIFTSQVWNMTFSWYQSLITIPKELRHAADMYRMNPWMRFRTLELPFAAIGLIWNSVMSWAGGWFFLMAAEIFTVGNRNFQLPGLGAYMQEAASQGDMEAILWGTGTLVLIIVALDQLVWRPLLAWSDRFKLEMVEGDTAPTSWLRDALLSSRFMNWLRRRFFQPAGEKIDELSMRYFPFRVRAQEERRGALRPGWPVAILGGAALVYGAVRAAQMLFQVEIWQWVQIALGTGATLLRVLAALAIAFAWTLPLGVAIGTSKRVAPFLQPLVQIAASIPATALFPVFLLFMLRMPGGLSVAAVFLMLMGTQWYLLFNIIAGASVIPQDLKYTTRLLHMSRRDRWRTLILPALFPYMITGGIAAGSGAWNASVVAEYVHFGGVTVHTIGIGAVIAGATAAGDYPLLLAATLTMILAVVLINRFWWHRLYRVAEERYRLE